MLLKWILGLAMAAGNLAFWWYAVRRGQERFRRWCERHYNVTIGLAGKGHWSVTGPKSWWRRFVIEWLQLAYFMTLFVVWAGFILLGFVAMGGP